jgi:hypothetical protein
MNNPCKHPQKKSGERRAQSGLALMVALCSLLSPLSAPRAGAQLTVGNTVVNGTLNISGPIIGPFTIDDVRAWGAATNTQCYLALQNALNYAVSNGIRMQVKGGVYFTTNTLSVTSAYSDFIDTTNRWGLVGDGKILCQGNNMPVLAFNGYNVSDFEIGDGLTLGYTTRQSSTYTNANIIYFGGTNTDSAPWNYWDGWIHGMAFINGYNGIYQCFTGAAVWEMMWEDLNFYWLTGSSINLSQDGGLGQPNIIVQRCYTRADYDTQPVYQFASINGLTVHALEINNATNVIGLLITNCQDVWVHDFHFESSQFALTNVAPVTIGVNYGNPQLVGFTFSSVNMNAPASGTNAFFQDSSSYVTSNWNDDISQIYIQNCTFPNANCWVALTTNVPMTLGVEPIVNGANTGLLGIFPPGQKIVTSHTSLVPDFFPNQHFWNPSGVNLTNNADAWMTNDPTGYAPVWQGWYWNGNTSSPQFAGSKIQLTGFSSDGNYSPAIIFASAPVGLKATPPVWQTNLELCNEGWIIPGGMNLLSPMTLWNDGITLTNVSAVYQTTVTNYGVVVASNGVIVSYLSNNVVSGNLARSGSTNAWLTGAFSGSPATNLYLNVGQTNYWSGVLSNNFCLTNLLNLPGGYWDVRLSVTVTNSAGIVMSWGGNTANGSTPLGAPDLGAPLSNGMTLLPGVYDLYGWGAGTNYQSTNTAHWALLSGNTNLTIPFLKSGGLSGGGGGSYPVAATYLATNSTTSGGYATNLDVVSGQIAAAVFSNSFIFSPFQGWRNGHVSFNGYAGGWGGNIYYTLPDGMDLQFQGTGSSTVEENGGYGSYIELTTGTTSGNQYLWDNNAFQFETPSGTWVGVWFIQLQQTTAERVWFGLASSGNANGNLSSDTFGGYDIAGFRYSTGASDTAWQGYNYNGSSATHASTGIAPDTNPHCFAIAVIAGGSTVFYIDGASVLTNASTLPASTEYQVFCGVATTTTSAVNMNFFQMYWAQHF